MANAYEEKIGIVPVGGGATRLWGSPKFMIPAPQNKFLLLNTIVSLIEAGADRVFVAVSQETELLVRAAISDVKAVSPYKVKTVLIDSNTVCEAVLEAIEWAARSSKTKEQLYAFAMPDVWTFNQPTFFNISLSLERYLAIAHYWLLSVEFATDFGCIEMEENERGEEILTSVVDKPPFSYLAEQKLVDAPIWGSISWHSSMNQYLRPEMRHMGEFLEAISKEHPVLCQKVGGEYFDVGTPNGFARYARFLAQGNGGE